MQTQESQDPLRVIVLLEGKHYVAQCLDYDIAVQAQDAQTLMRLLTLNLMTRITRAQATGTAPFEGLKAAPARYWEIFDKAPMQADQLRLPAGLPGPAPRFSIRVA